MQKATEKYSHSSGDKNGFSGLSKETEAGDMFETAEISGSWNFQQHITNGNKINVLIHK